MRHRFFGVWKPIRFQPLFYTLPHDAGVLCMARLTVNGARNSVAVRIGVWMEWLAIGLAAAGSRVPQCRLYSYVPYGMGISVQYRTVLFSDFST